MPGRDPGGRMIGGIFKASALARIKDRFVQLGGQVAELTARMGRLAQGSKAEVARLRVGMLQLAQERDVLARENAELKTQALALGADARRLEAEAASARELQRLIPFLRNLKREVLDLRQNNAALAKDKADLRQELERRAALAEAGKAPARPDGPDPAEELARLKRENGALRVRVGQQDQLIRSLKDVESRYKLLKRRFPNVHLPAQPATARTPGTSPAVDPKAAARP